MEKVLLATVVLPALNQFIVADAAAVVICEGKTCNPNEYCSPFNDICTNCSHTCDSNTHNYHAQDCEKFCPGYGNKDSLEDEIHKIKHQQDVLLILVSILVFIILISYAMKLFKWIRRNRYCTKFGMKFHSRMENKNPDPMPKLNMGGVSHHNNATTGHDGSTVFTVTTPISSRFPAEDSTTDFSYDNGGLQVTPISGKPSHSASGT